MTAKKIEPGASQVVMHGVEHLSPSGISSTRWILISHSHLWRPPTDVYETDEAYVVKVEVAGMSAENFGIFVLDRRVTIHGARPDPGGARAYHQMEIHFGEFRTDVELPGPVDRGAVTADYNDGYLKVVLPKRNPQKIDVK
jgi:HSP20 family protein